MRLIKGKKKYYDNDGKRLTPYEVKMYKIAQKRGDEYDKEKVISHDDFWRDFKN